MTLIPRSPRVIITAASRFLDVVLSFQVPGHQESSLGTIADDHRRAAIDRQARPLGFDEHRHLQPLAGV
jgi:hypothetical protein